MSRFYIRSLAGAAAGVTIAVCAPPAGATLIDDTITCEETNSTVFVCAPLSATVIDPGFEFTLGPTVNPLLRIDVGAETVRIFNSSTTTGVTTGTTIFTLGDFDWVGTPGKIIGLELTSVSGVTGIAAGLFSFTDDSVSVDLDAGPSHTFSPESEIVLTLLTMHDSEMEMDPEPGTTLLPVPATLGLVGFGVAAIGLVRRRRMS